MKAVCWYGTQDVRTETVADPRIINSHDAILRVTSASICGSDMHLYNGYVPTMKPGDILGHEFMGEVVEVGKDVHNIKKGDRVVVPSPIACGHCYYCEQGLFSCCDNTNPNAWMAEKIYNQSPAGIYGYSHAFGGFAGAFANYVRVPYADVGAMLVPEGLRDEQVLFISDALPTGFMGADYCNIKPGATVAVWGCGAVGLSAIMSAYLLGAGRVIAIDHVPYRLDIAHERCGAEVLNYEDVNIVEALTEMTGGRGPDACIDAVGMEAHNTGLEGMYDTVKQAVRLETDRPYVLREAILACRKGGTVVAMGVYSGFIDKFPMGAFMQKNLSMRSGQQHGQAYAPRLLGYIESGQLDTSFLASHPLPLDQAKQGFEMMRNKEDNVMRVVFQPA